jgi:hypothetical protein
MLHLWSITSICTMPCHIDFLWLRLMVCNMCTCAMPAIVPRFALNEHQNFQVSSQPQACILALVLSQRSHIYTMWLWTIKCWRTRSSLSLSVAGGGLLTCIHEFEKSGRTHHSTALLTLSWSEQRFNTGNQSIDYCYESLTSRKSGYKSHKDKRLSSVQKIKELVLSTIICYKPWESNSEPSVC